jgi:hypothetical protein
MDNNVGKVVQETWEKLFDKLLSSYETSIVDWKVDCTSHALFENSKGPLSIARVRCSIYQSCYFLEVLTEFRS